MPSEAEQHPDPVPPRGVPRWLWPPPGAEVRSLVVCERDLPEAPGAARAVDYAIDAGEPPEDSHLRALRWLLDEHSRLDLLPAGRPTPRQPVPGQPVAASHDAYEPSERRVRLEIAATQMPAGRVGHAYAIDGGPLGAPSGDAARGVLWRYIEFRVGP